MGKGFLQSLSDALGARTTRWDFLKRPEFGFPTDRPITGPTKPRPPTPGLHFPPGTHIPDWRSYKVEGHPHLEEVQRRLAARGLKDPWLRNEVWRYQFREWGNPKWQFQRWIFPSMAYGFAMFLVVLICEETIFKKKDGHGHGHGH